MLVSLNRRNFVSGLVAVGCSRSPALAQQRTPKIGVLWHAGNEQEEEVFLTALTQGLARVGYVVGKNILLENRFANEEYERFNGQAVELAAMNVDVLYAVTEPAALAAQRATKTIPIVFVVVPDPVAVKLVESLARPGGNLTGVATLGTGLVPKRFEYFKDILLSLSRVFLLVNPSDDATLQRVLAGSRAAATPLGLNVEAIQATTPAEIDKAVSIAAERGAQGLFLTPDAMYFNERKRIADACLKHNLPTMAVHNLFTEAGCLASYGPNFPELFRRSAVYIDKILKGATPAQLPVEQPTKYELSVNSATAKRLGISLNPTFIARANEVLE